MLEDLRVHPAPDEATRVQREEEARELQRAWGCPGAGHVPPTELPANLVDAAGVLLGMTGGDTETPASTCPCASIHAGNRWVVDLTRAMRRQSDHGIPLRDGLGRRLTVADHAAIDAWDDAHAARMESEGAEREAEHQAYLADLRNRPAGQ